MYSGDAGDAAGSTWSVVGLCTTTSHQHQLQGSSQLEHADRQGHLLATVAYCSVFCSKLFLTCDTKLFPVVR